MKNNLIKIALGMILVAGSAHAADTRTFANGYYFQNVNDITGNVTKNTGTLANRITVITTDQRWTSDTIYILNNLTFVESPATLTIEPGTIIRGEPVTTGGTSTLDPADPGSLIICRGAKIVAQGTAESPIYFTSIADPFVPGGEKTIPTVLPANSKPISAYNTAAYNGSYKAHDVDAQWGGLTILGRAPVGFGGGTSTGGNLQIAVSATAQGGNYTQNPKFTFTHYNVDRSVNTTSYTTSYSIEPLLSPVAVASVRVDNGGKFTGSKPTFKATAADGSRTAIKTVLGTPVVAYNFGANGVFNGTSVSVPAPANVGAVASDTTTGSAAASDDYWEIISVPLAANSSDDANIGGLQYNVPTKSGPAPFIKANGFSKAEVALEYTHSAGYLTTTASTEWATSGHAITAPTDGLPGTAVGGTVCTVYPELRLILNPTVLYGVIVKAPTANGVLPTAGYSDANPFVTVAISQGGLANSKVGSAAAAPSSQATATCSVSTSAVSDPSAIPLKGGIGANFIEGFQAIDGATYGLSFAPTVDSDGAAWTTFSGGIYGGSNSADNSGCIRFCRFSFGGYVLSPNNEINGVTYGGAGSGTVTEFVEIFNNADDDFEMFGGCNSLKYVAGIFGGDDGFDTDMGYRGNGQFMFQLQNNTKAGSIATGRPTANIGDNLGENDGNEDPNTIANGTYPGTEFTYFNLTAIGVGYNVNGTFPSDRSGVNFKDNSGGKILDSVYVEAPSGAIQDQSTTADTAAAGRRIALAPYGTPTVANEPQGVIAYNTWSKCAGGKVSNPVTANYTKKDATMFPITSGRTSSGGSTINNSFAVGKMLVDDLSNLFVGTDVVVSTGTNGRLNGVDPVLASGALERSNGTNPRNSIAVAVGATSGKQSQTVNRGNFFAPNTFRGAFRDFNWLKGWSLADQLGVFANNNVVVPDVTLTVDGSGNIVANFTGADLIQYNIEVSTDNKTYLPFSTETGTGGTISKNLARSGLTFVRVTPL